MHVTLSGFNRLALVVLVVSFLGPVTTHAQTTPACPQCRVTITDPAQDGVAVGRERDIKGTAAIPSGHSLWVLVHRTKGFREVWYPQDQGEIDPKTQAWEVHVNFGELRDVGYEFAIAVITVNGQENTRLHDFRRKAMASGDWKPIPMPSTTSAPVMRKVIKKSHD